MQGIITNIQRFSVHDGPGIRTTVFLKGCNLRCFWCHNPETLSPKPQLELYLERCIGCDECFRVCPRGAHVRVDGNRYFQRELCQACGQCAETCYAQGLVLVGRPISPEEVVAEVAQDWAFYESSGGGVTLSGGEPLLQGEFSYAILEQCRRQEIHTAIETAANMPWAQVAALLPVTDLVMMDIKLMDDEAHRQATGVSNGRILANAERLGGQSQPLIVRTPVIPGVNDTPEAIGAIAGFVSRLPNLLYYELLPFHPLAQGKYHSLGLDYRAAGLKAPAREQMDALGQTVAGHGIEVRVAR